MNIKYINKEVVKTVTEVEKTKVYELNEQEILLIRDIFGGRSTWELAYYVTNSFNFSRLTRVETEKAIIKLREELRVACPMNFYPPSRIA